MIAPKGKRLILANFRDCWANGMPTIVRHKRRAEVKCMIAKLQPQQTIQMILSSKLPAPWPISMAFPKGKRPKAPILKHCMPKGIPTIVKHRISPTIAQEIQAQKPEKINQIIFPISLICSPLYQQS